MANRGPAVLDDRAVLVSHAKILYSQMKQVLEQERHLREMAQSTLTAQSLRSEAMAQHLRRLQRVQEQSWSSKPVSEEENEGRLLTRLYDTEQCLLAEREASILMENEYKKLKVEMDWATKELERTKDMLAKQWEGQLSGPQNSSCPTCALRESQDTANPAEKLATPTNTGPEHRDSAENMPGISARNFGSADGNHELLNSGKSNGIRGKARGIDQIEGSTSRFGALQHTLRQAQEELQWELGKESPGRSRSSQVHTSIRAPLTELETIRHQTWRRTTAPGTDLEVSYADHLQALLGEATRRVERLEAEVSDRKREDELLERNSRMENQLLDALNRIETMESDHAQMVSKLEEELARALERGDRLEGGNAKVMEGFIRLEEDLREANRKTEQSRQEALELQQVLELTQEGWKKERDEAIAKANQNKTQEEMKAIEDRVRKIEQFYLEGKGFMQALESMKQTNKDDSSVKSPKVPSDITQLLTQVRTFMNRSSETDPSPSGRQLSHHHIADMDTAMESGTSRQYMDKPSCNLGRQHSPKTANNGPFPMMTSTVWSPSPGLGSSFQDWAIDDSGPRWVAGEEIPSLPKVLPAFVRVGDGGHGSPLHESTSTSLHSRDDHSVISLSNPSPAPRSLIHQQSPQSPRGTKTQPSQPLHSNPNPTFGSGHGFVTESPVANTSSLAMAMPVPGTNQQSPLRRPQPSIDALSAASFATPVKASSAHAGITSPNPGNAPNLSFFPPPGPRPIGRFQESKEAKSWEAKSWEAKSWTHGSHEV